MKFYRDWLIIDMDVYGLSLFLTLVLAFAFYFLSQCVPRSVFFNICKIVYGTGDGSVSHL